MPVNLLAQFENDISNNKKIKTGSVYERPGRRLAGGGSWLGSEAGSDAEIQFTSLICRRPARIRSLVAVKLIAVHKG